MMLRRGRPVVAARARGAALIVLMALLAMGVLYFLVVQLAALSGYEKESRGASDSLAQAREALLGYAATYRDTHPDLGNNKVEVFGYLPCPDTVGDGRAAPSCGNAGEASVGLLPFRTLGLADLRDTSGVCLWYAVAGSFKNNPKAAATLMNWDTQGQFTVLDSNGATLITPEDAQGGAAAVIFATGLPLAGQSSRSPTSVGPCQIDPTQVAAYLDGAYTFTTNATIALTQGPIKDANGIVTNNDRLAWITPKEIFDRVIRRPDFSNALTASPPGQINTLIDRLAKAVEKQIQDDVFNATSTSMPTNVASYAPQPGSAAMGNVDSTTDVSLASDAANGVDYANYRNNWSDQLRQIRCNNVSTACLDINNGGTANCRGALVFAGRTAGGQPRTSAQKVPSIANLANYFESGLALLTSAGAFTGSSSFSGSAASADVAACLGYGTFDSLKQSAAAFSSGTVTPGGGATSVATVTGVGGPNPTIVLGGGTLVARSGCVWRPTPLPLNSSLRLYFTYTIASASTGQGFTLALADAATNNPSSTEPVMCGATGQANLGSLGYSGAPVSGSVSGTADITGTGWGPTIGPPPFFPIINVATITTAANHGYATNDIVTISGANPAGYNGTYSITVTSPTQFTYVLPTNPGPPYMGIFPPKIGLEFDTANNTPRNDPSSDHVAFVQWGGASDNNPAAATRNGNDDNTHNSGVNGDGSQPLNPRSLSITAASATPVATIAAARWSGGTASISTAAPHGYATGQSVTISDISPLGYKGTYTITIPSVSVTSASWAAGTATFGTAIAHGLLNGQTVVVAGVAPTAYNGTFLVKNVIDATHLSVAVVADPGLYLAGGQLADATRFTYAKATDPGKYPYTATVSAASWALGTATITTSVAHGLATGDTVTLSNMSPTAWNGSYSVTVTDASHFTVAIAGNPGAYVAGGQVSAPLSSISAAAWSGSQVSVTTSNPHGLISEQFVTISGASPSGYNGTYRIKVSSSTQFSYFLLSSPGNYVSGGSIAVAGAASSAIASIPVSGAVWAAGIGTITTSATHGLTSGNTVALSNLFPATWNGTYAVTVIDPTHFSVAIASDPTAYTSGGHVSPVSVISAAAWSGNQASVTTSAAHGLANGQVAQIAGVYPAAYNGAYAVTVIDATHFSYALAGDPGGAFSAATFAYPGIATVKVSDPYLPYAATPVATTIHVRLDISRRYDASRRQATLTLQAYVGDTFTGTCAQADFKNFARDLAELCPSRSPTVEQDGLVINDAAGPALGNIYLGFTTARRAVAGNNETINIQNLILRSQ